MTAVLETRHRPRKKLPDIPPEELALHGKTDLENGNTYHELPAEVQVQFMRHVHRRSHSLTGLDTVKFEKQQCVVSEKEKSESESKQQNVEELQNRQSTINTEKDIPAFIMSLPTTPGSFFGRCPFNFAILRALAVNCVTSYYVFSFWFSMSCLKYKENQ